MKRLIAIALVVALVVTAIAVSIPAFAAPGGVQGPAVGNRVVFESDFIDIPEGDELTGGGEVRVRANGDVKVEIKGAPADREYFVVIVYGPDWDRIPSFLGYMTEYNNGKYKLETSLSSPPLPPLVGGPLFVIIDEASPAMPQFVSGFYLPLP